MEKKEKKRSGLNVKQRFIFEKTNGNVKEKKSVYIKNKQATIGVNRSIA